MGMLLERAHAEGSGSPYLRVVGRVVRTTTASFGRCADTRSAIRADLLAAREASTASQLPDSEAAKRLTVYRSHAGRQGPPLALVARHHPEADTEPEVLISLAGVLFVTWPFADLPHGTWRPGCQTDE